MCCRENCCSWRLGAIIVSIILIVCGAGILSSSVAVEDRQPFGTLPIGIGFSVGLVLFGILLLFGVCIQNRWIVLAFVVLYPFFTLAMGIVIIVYFTTNDLENVGFIIGTFVINMVIGAIKVFVAFMYYRKLSEDYY